MIVDISLDEVTNPSASRQQQPVLSVEYSPDDSIIASAENTNCIDLWTREGKPLHKLPMSNTSSGILTRFSHNGQFLATGDIEGVIRIWNTADWAMGHELKSHGCPKAAAWSPNGSHLAVGVIDDEDSLLVYLWNPQTGRLLGDPIREATHMFNAVALSADGCTLAAASRDDCTVRLWEVRTGEQIGMPLTGHTRDIRAITFSPDGSKLVTGGNDKAVRVWDLRTGKQLFKSIMHGKWVQSTTFSPNGKAVYYASNDRCIHAFHSDTGSPMGRPIKGHTKGINSIAISHDGKHIVSGGEDGALRLWDSQAFFWNEDSGIYRGLRGPERVPESAGEDGWIRTLEGGLVIWVPTQYRDRVCDMSSLDVKGEPEDRLIRIQWDKLCIGDNWASIYSP